MNQRKRNTRTCTIGFVRSALVALALGMYWSGSAVAQANFLEALDSDATGPNATASGTAIISTCATGANAEGSAENVRFQQDCNILVLDADQEEDSSSVEDALNSLAADQVSGQNSVAVRRADSNLSVVDQRMQLLRIASGVAAFGQDEMIAQNLALDGMTGGGASADSGSSRWGGFLNGRYLTGDEDDNALQDGFDFDGYGLLAGVDYRFSDNFVGGLAVSYSDGEVDYDNNRGELDVEEVGAFLYGTYYLESGLFFEGSLGYSSIEYDLTRNINYQVGNTAPAADVQMTSSPDADLYSFSLGGGYTITRDSWSFTPALRFDYLENEVDSYSEASSNLAGTGGAMALQVDSIEYESFTSNLGVQITNAISTDNGVVVPHATVNWIHEFEDDTTAATAVFLNDINKDQAFSNPVTGDLNNNAFVLETTDLDSDYFELLLGLSAQFKGGTSCFVSYRTLLDYDGLTYHGIEAGVRLEF